MLYEQNIGMLTPMIADELRDAERHYPAEWIADAFREAVELNKRSWRYVVRILERWRVEGRKDSGRERRQGQVRGSTHTTCSRRALGRLIKQRKHGGVG